MAKPTATKAVFWPGDLERRYGVTGQTRINWERNGRLPPRDVFIGGKAEGWYVSTIEAAERNEAVRP